MAKLNKVKSIESHINLRIANNYSNFRFKNYQRLVIDTSLGKRIIPFENIIYIKAESNYSHINTVDGKSFLVAQTLKSVENNLNEIFFRVHKSFVVNLLLVDLFKSKSSTLLLMDGSEIHVARARKSALSKLFVC